MRIFRSLGIMIMVFTAAAVFAGCARGRPSAGQVLPPPLVATPGDRDIVVAKVNDAEITRESLIDIMNRMSAVNERNSFSESREATRERALEKLIFDELAFQEARRRGLSPGEGALDRAMGTIKANLGNNEETYKNFLSKQGLSEEGLRPQVERVLLLQLIVGQEVIEKAGVSDDTVRKEYERQKDRLVVPGKATVEDVVLFLKLDDTASMTKANEILASINAAKDKDPANVAVDGTFIVQRVELDKEKEPTLYDAAGKLKEGERSGVIRTSDSLHIIRLVAYQPERQRAFDEVKGPLKAKLRSDAQEKRRREWERELKKGAKIEIMGPEGRKKN